MSALQGTAMLQITAKINEEIVDKQYVFLSNIHNDAPLTRSDDL